MYLDDKGTLAAYIMATHSLQKGLGLRVSASWIVDKIQRRTCKLRVLDTGACSNRNPRTKTIRRKEFRRLQVSGVEGLLV